MSSEINNQQANEINDRPNEINDSDEDKNALTLGSVTSNDKDKSALSDVLVKPMKKIGRPKAIDCTVCGEINDSPKGGKCKICLNQTKKESKLRNNININKVTMQDLEKLKPKIEKTIEQQHRDLEKQMQILQEQMDKVGYFTKPSEQLKAAMKKKKAKEPTESDDESTEIIIEPKKKKVEKEVEPKSEPVQVQEFVRQPFTYTRQQTFKPQINLKSSVADSARPFGRYRK